MENNEGDMDFRHSTVQAALLEEMTLTCDPRVKHGKGWRATLPGRGTRWRAESLRGNFWCQSQHGWSRAGERMSVGWDEVGELSKIPSHRASQGGKWCYLISAFKKLIWTVAWRTDWRRFCRAVLRVNNGIHSGLSRKDIYIYMYIFKGYAVTLKVMGEDQIWNQASKSSCQNSVCTGARCLNPCASGGELHVPWAQLSFLLLPQHWGPSWTGGPCSTFPAAGRLGSPSPAPMNPNL